MICSGAENVIGFNEITLVSECNEFAERFFTLTVQQGIPVQDAIDRMQNPQDPSYIEMADWTVRGHKVFNDPLIYLN